MSDKRKKTPRDLLRMVMRRRALFLVSAGLFAAAALVASHWIQPKYTGQAIFELRADPAGGDISPKSSWSLDAVKLTLKEDLSGYTAVKKAAEDMGLTRTLQRGFDGQLTLDGKMAEQELVGGLIKVVQLDFGSTSSEVTRVSVSVTHPEAAIAEQLPNVLVHNYIERTRGAVIDSFRSSMEAVKNKLSDLESRLRELNEEKVRFERENAGGVPPDSVGMLEERILSISSDIDSRRLQYETARQKLARYQALLGTSTEPASQPVQWHKAPNPAMKELQEELRKTQQQLRDAREINNMTEDHPTVISLKKKVEQLQETIKNTDEEVVVETVYGSGPGSDVARTELTMQVAAASAELETVGSELGRLESRLGSFRDLMANFGKVRADYEAILKKIADQESETKTWQSKYASLQMAFDAEMMNRRMHLNAIQTAQKQFRPSFPQLWTVLALAVVGALAFGGSLVLLAGAIDRSLATPEEAAELQLPVLGAIDEIVTPGLRRVRRMRRLVLWPAVGVVMAALVAVAGLSVVLWLQYPQVYEQFRAGPASFLMDSVVEPIRSRLGV
jgi:uncharacterized protein involved in exopolysaccharide biosynthesis